jgi:tripartite-type tricarboxylate transporter receptor subunit TctC
LPGSNLAELIAWLKTNPNRASAGRAALPSHLIAALFQKETADAICHLPYRGGAPASRDLVAGHIDLLISSPDKLPMVRAVPAARPRKVKDYSDGARKPDLCGTAWWGW